MLNFHKQTIKSLFNRWSIGVEDWDDVVWTDIKDNEIHNLILLLLNSEGIKTERGKSWTKRSWRDFRRELNKQIKTRRDLFSLLDNLDICLEDEREYEDLFARSRSEKYLLENQHNRDKESLSNYHTQSNYRGLREVVDWSDKNEREKVDLDKAAHLYISDFSYRRRADRVVNNHQKTIYKRRQDNGQKIHRFAGTG